MEDEYNTRTEWLVSVRRPVRAVHSSDNHSSCTSLLVVDGIARVHGALRYRLSIRWRRVARTRTAHDTILPMMGMAV